MLDSRELDRRIGRYMAANDVPGLALSIFTGDEPLYARGFGRTSIEGPPAAVTPDTVFRIYSVAKSLTGTLLCALSDEGVLDLDEVVESYVPEFGVRGRSDSSGITLRHLLSHQAGFVPDAVLHDGFSRDPVGLEAAMLEEAPRYPRIAAPGQLYSYSNLGVSMAGYIAQRVTGTPFADLIREALFEPLGMDTTIHDSALAMTYPLAQHHVPDGRGGVRVVHAARDATKHHPSSLCFSTASDMARFGRLHLNAGANVLSAERVAEMHRPAVDLLLDINLRYGLTMYIGPTAGDADRVGHEGFYDGMWCKLALAPRHGVGLVWLDNRGPELSEQRYAIVEEVFEELGAGPSRWARPDAVEPSVDPDRLTGRYIRRLGEGDVTIARAGDQLVVRRDAGELEVTAVGSSVYAGKADASWAGVPWAPHAGSRRVSLGFVRGPGDGPSTHALLNAIPLARA
jgi:CubicO group peptidase (beta-lactamase class C family)